MKSSSHMLRIGNIAGLPRIYDELGLDFPGAVRKLGLNPAVFEDAEAIIPYAALDGLLSIARDEAKCEHVGLMVGMAPPNLGLPGFLALHAPTVRAGLEDLISSLRLSDQGGVANLEVHGDVAMLTYSVIVANLKNLDLVCDGAIAIGYGLLNLVTHDADIVSEIRLIRRKPADTAPYRAYFGHSRVVYDSSIGVIQFDASALDRPIPHADPALYEYLKALMASNSAKSPSPSLVEQIRALLPRLMRHQEITSCQVAHLLGVNTRTLARRLAEKQITLRQIILETRLESAAQLLRNTDMSLTEIAESMSYSDASAFSRAFKAKHAMTPGDWRKRNQNGA